MFAKTAAVVALAALPSAYAALSVCLFGFADASELTGRVQMTSPVASTQWVGGQPQNIAWMDDGKAPTLQQFGNASIGIYVGNVNQQVCLIATQSLRTGIDIDPPQTLLQTIVDSVDVSTTASVTFTPNPSIGPDSNV